MASVIVIIPDFNHLVFAGLAIGHLGCQIREIHGFWKNQIAVRVQGKDRLGIAEYIIGSLKKPGAAYIIFCLVFGDIGYGEVGESIIQKL